MQRRPGDRFVFRSLWHGRVFGATAGRLVEAGDGHVVVWFAPGSERKLPPGRHQPWDRDWVHADRPWHGEGVLMLKQLEAAHSIWLFRETGGAFAAWYGNLEEPARETPIPTGWEEWEPPSEWEPPTLPEDWDVV